MYVVFRECDNQNISAMIDTFFLSLFLMAISLFLCSFFFFKQKPAYEMRISDWSSDVCSSDLEPQLRMPEIAAGLIGEQRMIPAILGLPDQPCQVLPVMEHRLDAQRIGRRRHHARHHRPREIDGPEPRVEALDPALPVMRFGRHQRPAHQSVPSATARRTARASCRPVCASRCGSLAAPPCTFTVIAMVRAPPAPAVSIRPLAAGTNSSGPFSPTR